MHFWNLNNIRFLLTMSTYTDSTSTYLDNILPMLHLSYIVYTNIKYILTLELQKCVLYLDTTVRSKAGTCSWWTICSAARLPTSTCTTSCSTSWPSQARPRIHFLFFYGSGPKRNTKFLFKNCRKIVSWLFIINNRLKSSNILYNISGFESIPVSRMGSWSRSRISSGSVEKNIEPSFHNNIFSLKDRGLKERSRDSTVET